MASCEIHDACSAARYGIMYDSILGEKTCTRGFSVVAMVQCSTGAATEARE